MHWRMHCLAASRCAGCRTLGQRPTGAQESTKGVFRDCVADGTALKYRWNCLYSDGDAIVRGIEEERDDWDWRIP